MEKTDRIRRELVETYFLLIKKFHPDAMTEFDLQISVVLHLLCTLFEPPLLPFALFS